MTYYDDHLQHHGVKGMKWGVRRAEKAKGKRDSAKKDYDESKTRLNTLKGSAKNASDVATKAMNNEIQNAIKTAKELGLPSPGSVTFSSTTGRLIRLSMELNQNIPVLEGNVAKAKKKYDKREARYNRLTNK